MEKLKHRSEVDNNSKWDLTPIYKTDEDFEKSLIEVNNLIEGFNKYKEKMMNSAHDLYATLEEDTKIDQMLNHLYMYAHLNKDSDTTNQKYQTMYEEVLNLITKYDEEASSLIPTILKYDYSKIENFYKEEEKLLEYKFVLEQVFRKKEHVLSNSKEKILSGLSNAFDFPEKIYDLFTNAELKFGTIKNEKGEDVEITDSNFSIFIRSQDRSVREQAFKTLYNGYSNYKNTIALMLANDVKINNSVAKIRKFNSTLESALFTDNIDISVYQNLIDTVENNLSPLYKYLNIKKKILGVNELHLYDVYMPLIKEVKSSYTFDEAKDLVINALSVFGDDYINNLKKAFDEKWIDIYPNIGKISGAYSSGSYTTNPYILLNFQGELTDVSTLAHELGHSMHSYYSRKNNSYQNSSYKIFVAEVASTVNELLLAHYMLEHSNDNKEKLSILNRLLELFRTTIYRQTMFASFEKEIYDKDLSGEILTSDVMCDAYYKLNKKYFGEDVVVDDEIRYEWLKVPHFYYYFYVYKYATGLSAASHIVKRILNKEENAVEDYLSFLKTGGSMYPLDELKVAGVDMTDEKVIESAIEMFNDLLNEFEDLYNKEYSK